MLCPLRQKRTHKPLSRSGRKQQARGRPARSGTVPRLKWDYTGQLSGVAGYPASEKWSPFRVLTPGAEAGAAFRHPDSDTCWEQLDLRSDAATADGPTRPPRLQIMWHFSVIRADRAAQRLPRVLPDRRRLWGSDYKRRLMYLARFWAYPYTLTCVCTVYNEGVSGRGKWKFAVPNVDLT